MGTQEEQNCVDSRIGEHFDNPDYTSDHYYAKKGVNGWGLLVTPDELRYHYMWGNPLTSSRGDNFVDAQLQKYVDRTIGMVEKDLNHVIVATQYRHRPPINGVPRDDLPKESEDENAPLKPFVYEDLYDFKKDDYEQYVRIKLKKKPIVELQKWNLFDISSGAIILDLTGWAKLRHNTGFVRAYPRGDSPFTIGGGANTGPTVVTGVNVGGFVGAAPGLFPATYKRYPGGYGLDYIAGYPNAKDVPEDLSEIVGMLAAINLMADYGDGVVSGLANASVSLSGISESFGTTMSATSAFFGARIKDYSDRISAWMKENKSKYRGIQFRSF